jgi:CheY-like chemotaxis protein
MSRFALVAEPDPSLSAAQVAVVDALGLVPLVAQDGERAIWLLRRFGTPALLLTSLSLPVVDGFELLDWLRTRGNARATKVIVTSAFPELRAFASALRGHLGIDVVLPRDASVEVLRGAAQDLLAGEDHADPVSIEALSSPPSVSVRSLREAPTDPRLGWFVRSIADELRCTATAAVVALDEGRVLVSAVGFEASKWPHLVGFGRHVLGAGQTLVVADAFAHPFFQGDVAVATGSVRGFAGAPVLDATGRARGMLCVIEPRSRLRIGPEGLGRLAERARQIGTTIPYLGASASRIVRPSRRRILDSMPDSAPASTQR